MLWQLLEHVGANWHAFWVILVAALPASLSIFGLGLKMGGEREFERWILHVTKPAQDGARARLRRALDMDNPCPLDERCSELVGGIDDWRVSLDRSQRPLSWVRRSWPPLISIIVMSAISLAGKGFNDMAGEVFAILAMLSIAWFVVAFAPLVPWLRRHGLPQKIPDGHAVPASSGSSGSQPPPEAA